MAAVENEVILSLYMDQPIYRDLLEDFASCLDERMSQCRVALEKHNWKDLATLMHQLRGAAATYGFPGLAEMAGVVEIDSLQTSVVLEKMLHSFETIVLICKKIEAGMKAD